LSPAISPNGFDVDCFHLDFFDVSFLLEPTCHIPQ